MASADAKVREAVEELRAELRPAAVDIPRLVAIHGAAFRLLEVMDAAPPLPATKEGDDA